MSPSPFEEKKASGKEKTIGYNTMKLVYVLVMIYWICIIGYLVNELWI